MSSRFNLGSTLKTLNLSLLRFNEWPKSENLARYPFILLHKCSNTWKRVPNIPYS